MSEVEVLPRDTRACHALPLLLGFMHQVNCALCCIFGVVHVADVLQKRYVNFVS